MFRRDCSRESSGRRGRRGLHRGSDCQEAGEREDLNPRPMGPHLAPQAESLQHSSPPAAPFSMGQIQRLASSPRSTLHSCSISLFKELDPPQPCSETPHGSPVLRAKPFSIHP